MFSDDFTFHYAPPNPKFVRLAALKNAYLAACLLLEQIPKTPLADAVRAELVAAVRRPRDEPFELSDHCKRLMIGHSYGPAEPGEIALSVSEPSPGKPEFVVTLARTMAVSWPLEPITVGPAA
jgi:hypothetical protein